METKENRIERIARNIAGASDFERDDIEPLAWMEYFTEYEVATKSEMRKIEAHLDIVDLCSKRIISERSFSLFEIMYDYVGGFQSYKDAEEMARSSFLIKAVYDGRLENINNFQIEKCYAIATYEQKFGIKMTALASNTICLDRTKVLAAANKLQRESLKYCWLECSGKAERFVMKNGGGKCIIDPMIIKNKVYTNREVEIDKDGIHYTRVLSGSGQKVRKMAIGKICVS